MTPEEQEKLLRDLGAQLVSTREEIKALQESPKADPKTIKQLSDDFAGLKKTVEEIMAKMTLDPEPKPGTKPEPKPETKPKVGARGFGFFN